MLYLVTGGSGSGKSEYAENLALSFQGMRRLYLATMRVWDEEGKRRVERHRRMRSGKGFLTAEQDTNLENFRLSEIPETADWDTADVILLECMSNLAANEFYDQEEGAEARILQGIKHLQKQCRRLIIVTNEVFSDGMTYDPETERYIALLGRVNQRLGEAADSVTEVVYGIPVPIFQSQKKAGKNQ